MRHSDRDNDDQSCSTATTSSQVFNINSYYRVPVEFPNEIDSDAAGTNNTVNAVRGLRRVAVVIYDTSETDSTPTNTSINKCSASSMAFDGAGYNSARASTPRIIRPPYKSKNGINRLTKRQKEIQTDMLESSFYDQMFSCFSPHDIDGQSLVYPNQNVDSETRSFDPVKSRTLSTQQHAHAILHQKDMIDTVFEGLENYTCAGETKMGRRTTHRSKSRNISENRMRDMANNQIMAVPHYDKDVLDGVFEGIEKASCGEPSPYDYYDRGLLVVHEQDYLDKMFDGMETVACRDDSETLDRERGWIGDNSRDDDYRITRSKHRANGSKEQYGDRQDGDSLDHVCGNLERSLGVDFIEPNSALQQDQPKSSLQPDILDSVFEPMENAVCRDLAPLGCPESPIDLTGEYELASPVQNRDELSSPVQNRVAGRKQKSEEMERKIRVKDSNRYNHSRVERALGSKVDRYVPARSRDLSMISRDRFRRNRKSNIGTTREYYSPPPPANIS